MTARDVTVLGGAIRAHTVTASCRHGAATSQAVARIIGRMRGRVTVAYDVRHKNQDGSMTVIGMQVRVHTDGGTVINIASATCALAPHLSTAVRARRDGDAIAANPGSSAPTAPPPASGAPGTRASVSG